MTIRKIFVLITLLFVSLNVQAGDFPNSLLFSKNDIPRIKKNTENPIFKDFWQSEMAVDIQTDRNFCRQAFIYLITGEEERADYAKLKMLESVKLKRWDYYVEDRNISLGFLQGGRMTAWMSLCYDWLYDRLSPEERNQILNAIAEKGCLPCYRGLYGMRHPETVKGWGFDPERNLPFDVPDMSRWPHILGRNNFRAVISGGFALGIFTLAGKDQRAEEWYEMLIDSYYRFIKEFKADGSYEEGMSYCNYAMSYLVYLMEVVNRKKGIDLFDEANYMGIMQSNLALYLPHLLEPNGSVNFGDAGNSMNSANGFWIARQAKDGLSQYIALNHADKRDFLSLVWYDNALSPTPPTNLGYFYKSELDWITSRTGFGVDDLVVAMRSGGPANHEHGDRNSIILKQFGEILLCDRKHPTYHRYDPGWFLRTSLAHNTVVIDGKGHQYHSGEEGTNESKASAEIVRYGQRNGYVYWASDATPAYALLNDDIQSVTRTVFVFQEMSCLIVADKLVKKGDASDFSARWHIENSDGKGSGSTSEASFMITRPNAKLYACCAGTPDVNVVSTLLPLPDSTGVFPYIDVSTKKKAKEALLIFAGIPLRSGEKTPVIDIEKDGNIWTIKAARNNMQLVMDIYDKDKLPEFEVKKYK